VFRTVGPFDERLFIDLVDTEFALRLQVSGMETLVAPGLDLPHRLGAARQIHVMGKSVTVGLSAPFRYYYRARNRVLVGAKYVRWQPVTMLREALRDMFQMLWPVAFAKPRFGMCTVILAGIIDGVRKRGGPIPERVASLARSVAWRGRDVPP
jgi:rhamnosyltransferase